MNHVSTVIAVVLAIGPDLIMFLHLTEKDYAKYSHVNIL